MQLGYGYSMNKKAIIPLDISICGLDFNHSITGRALTELTAHNWDQGRGGVTFISSDVLNAFPREDIIYLTADSDNCIHELDPSKVYVIGGLVDRNKQKGASLSRAAQSNVRHARWHA
ncbi:hypothetical protein GUITHDRAFT_110142 [Guillardia theta CCMP2712]|uniref:tRNA (guanine(9)-N(1))-methyltransferase n=1 Tax=Guillardia theta (strain CCMP2712) TaxID=905079 RepID=L1J7F9_GUITC|nr:hypothetical protein GUITHDRAFT_110142 [Guillardia theta CCMP2712]EKX44039.1 hypothetical protein GUITHDRAFT_110142 [Guillardia theta CCMP2712]|eukprot:XP_005831019.1 hypothetical protein GUITHDRAFT_110142 [Guillardia theta CCMP2712]